MSPEWRETPSLVTAYSGAGFRPFFTSPVGSRAGPCTPDVPRMAGNAVTSDGPFWRGVPPVLRGPRGIHGGPVVSIGLPEGSQDHQAALAVPIPTPTYCVPDVPTELNSVDNDSQLEGNRAREETRTVIPSFLCVYPILWGAKILKAPDAAPSRTASGRPAGVGLTGRHPGVRYSFPQRLTTIPDAATPHRRDEWMRQSPTISKRRS